MLNASGCLHYPPTPLCFMLVKVTGVKIILKYLMWHKSYVVLK